MNQALEIVPLDASVLQVLLAVLVTVGFPVISVIVTAIEGNVAVIWLSLIASVGVELLSFLSLVLFGFDKTRAGLVVLALYSILLVCIGQSATGVTYLSVIVPLFLAIDWVQHTFFESAVKELARDVALLLEGEDVMVVAQKLREAMISRP